MGVIDNTLSAADLARQARHIADDVQNVGGGGNGFPVPGLGSLSLAVMLLARAVEILAAEDDA